ncbi:MAG: PP2C family protein-serine/threonine phosphatase [Planctomycetota bacterium]
MSESAASLRVLESLTEALAGDLTVRLFDREGALRAECGPGDDTRVDWTGEGLAVTTGPGRTAVQRLLGREGAAVVTFDVDQELAMLPFLDAFFQVLIEKEQVESDLESMNSGSLALLEEVSMFSETLPRLPTGRSVVEVAEMGLSALVMAASVKRALYVEYREVTEHCEVLIQVDMDESGRHARAAPYAGDPVLPPGESIVWLAVRGAGDAILSTVPENGHLGAPGSPESLAARELIAVPVTYGGDDKRVVLGVLLLMDKQPNAYSSSTELGSQQTKLATSIAAMLGSALGTRKVAELNNELAMANEIQLQILPEGAPQTPGYDLAGRCSNSGAVGGDYFDYLPMADGRTLVVVADVSGHNLASGMIMVGARATLRTLAAKEAQIEQMFDDLARSLYSDLTRTERFITAVGAALRPEDQNLELVNAGHNDSMVYRAATGDVERIPSDSTVLGFLPEPQHQARTTHLESGDVLLLYTDGVVEATNADDEMLGEERLVEVLQRAATGSASDILEAVFAAVESFSDPKTRGDDVTAVVVKAPSRPGSKP